MNNSFGEFLKQKRLEKQLTQKEFAKKLFVSESAISKWEKNIAHPDITLLPKLSEILGVSEHELITSSIDKQSREEKVQAKKWRTFSLSWSLFFYISYALTLVSCFICNLAINRGLTWFWIVLSALSLTFTFTNLPKLIKKHKLFLLPLSMYLSLCLLLGVCCIYTNGNWVWVTILSILFALIIVFVPIYIAKYKVFSKIKKHADFISIGIDFVMLNILLVVIYSFTKLNGYTNYNWYLKIAFPIALIFYLFLNILLSVKFLKTNKLFKTSIILFLINFALLIPPMFIKVENKYLQEEIDDLNILRANLNHWIPDETLENNIALILFLTLSLSAITLLILGLQSHIKRKNKS